MATKSKTYTDQMNNAQIMATALSANLETLKKRGMTEELITIKNSEQERLKGKLKLVTATVETVLKQLHGQMKEAITVVKLEVPQSPEKAVFL